MMWETLKEGRLSEFTDSCTSHDRIFLFIVCSFFGKVKDTITRLFPTSLLSLTQRYPFLELCFVCVAVLVTTIKRLTRGYSVMRIDVQLNI